jgi:hypothetical protein
MKYQFVILAAWLVPAIAAAQQSSVEGHASYARTTQTHQSSWGAGAQYQMVWGAKNAPVQLGTSLGGDWMQQENSGPTTWSLSYDATLQPGGGGSITPYAGGSISANWLSGGGAPSGAQLGLEYILGVQLKPEAQGPLSLKFEVRPGYVKTQEHTVTGRFGVSYDLK